MEQPGLHLVPIWDAAVNRWQLDRLFHHAGPCISFTKVCMNVIVIIKHVNTECLGIIPDISILYQLETISLNMCSSVRFAFHLARESFYFRKMYMVVLGYRTFSISLQTWANVWPITTASLVMQSFVLWIVPVRKEVINSMNINIVNVICNLTLAIYSPLHFYWIFMNIENILWTPKNVFQHAYLVNLGRLG